MTLVSLMSSAVSVSAFCRGNSQREERFADDGFQDVDQAVLQRTDGHDCVLFQQAFREYVTTLLAKTSRASKVHFGTCRNDHACSLYFIMVLRECGKTQ